MLQSHLFTKTRREAPADEVSKNAIILTRAGFIHKEMAGVYSLLPLGFLVLENIKQIIREEMNKEGGQEMFMTALQDREIWEKTDRWADDKVDNWFKTALKNGNEIGLSITHEEPLTRIMTNFVSSYRDLPIAAYQFQTKFRNEVRAKSGILRGREFLMKDLYDFSKDEAEHNEFYDRMRDAYKRVFDRCGIGHITYLTFASGGTFSKFSEEFQTICESGEDVIFVDEEKGIAVNKEVNNDEVLKELGLEKTKLVEKKAIECGNIFHLGTKFSEPLGLYYTTESGEKKPVYMGSYGIGPSRLMGTIVEALADDNKMVWPKEVAPFAVHLIEIPGKEAEKVREASLKIYQYLNSKGIPVLFDDRDKSAGEKFAEADLIGVPVRIVVGKGFIEKQTIELEDRIANEKIEINAEELEEIGDKFKK
jgi:prolyl-tRNA synthetase